MEKTLRLKVVNGTIQMIYSDAASSLLARGQATTRRASHVEPARDYGVDDDGWIADMRPVILNELGGDCFEGDRLLGPFPLREQALQAEAAFLRTHLGV